MKTDGLLKECECAVVTSPASLYYLSGFDQSDAVILLTKEQNYYITNPLYEVAVKSSLKGDFIVKILDRREQTSFIREILGTASTVGVECDHLTLTAYHLLLGELNCRPIDISSHLKGMRAVKTDAELGCIKLAEGMVDDAFHEILPLLRIGVTEREIKDKLLFALLARGAEGVAFDTIVAFGENAAMPHAVSSDRPLKQGDCILMDFGAKYRGYCSDFTRTVCCGAPSDAFRAAYEDVLNAQRAAIAYIERGGRSASEADKSARAVIDSGRYQGLFRHTLGHGVGIEIHEAPYLSEKSEDLLQEHAVFTLEPGIYVEGAFGIRIESLVAIENGKLTVIDRSDKEIYTV